MQLKDSEYMSGQRFTFVKEKDAEDTREGIELANTKRHRRHSH